ncbi:hypothetical protein UFOVP673_36 [uncultured Caudovirales phage]|uniref:Uncharacterized protein n=1 Tax=uncultured Caudovirales phage TaxID=2100421 RepID=A0A6J5NBD2_9CAUD|nr:hypothetical protein UFOVP673_36 [uncultured Caudovirales phage]
MSDTPRSDDFIGLITGIYMTEGEIAMCDFARELERELNAAKAALSGRTVSCSNCNAMAEEIAAMKKVIRKVYYETETYADGAPDATDHDKLCNEVSSQLEPFIK